MKNLNSTKKALSAVSKFALRGVVEVNGLEPMTSCVQGRRSPS